MLCRASPEDPRTRKGWWGDAVKNFEWHVTRVLWQFGVQRS